MRRRDGHPAANSGGGFAKKNKHMKTYDISKRISAQARKEIERIIDTHDRYKKCYFFKPDGSARGRRENERRFAEANQNVAFKRDEEIITVSMSYKETCRNVYYKLYVKSSLFGYKSISYIKNLIK